MIVDKHEDAGHSLAIAIGWQKFIFLILFNAVVALWCIEKPGSHTIFLIGIVILDLIAPTIGAIWTFQSALAVWRHDGIKSAHSLRPLRWALVLICVFMVSNVVTQVLSIPPILFSKSDHIQFSSLLIIPFAVSYVTVLTYLLLPARPLSMALRARIVGDGLMSMTVLATIAWLTIVGPMFLRAHASMGEDITEGIFLLFDVGYAIGMLIMSARSRQQGLQEITVYNGILIALTIVLQVWRVNQGLNGGYVPGLTDIGWCFILSIGGITGPIWQWLLTGRLLRLAIAPQKPVSFAGQMTPLWRLLLPYSAIPIIGACVLWAWYSHADSALFIGGIVGAITIGVITFLRQMFALVENQRLFRKLLISNARFADLATTDALTGLPNHRAMSEIMDSELELSIRQNRCMSLLFVDLDHFKAINDSRGHNVGDKVLCDAATVFRRSIRLSDSVGRWGGEEFVVVLPDASSDEAVMIAERIRAELSCDEMLLNAVGAVTCSIGVASYPKDGNVCESLIAAADSAMYAAKALGRNQVQQSAA